MIETEPTGYFTNSPTEHEGVTIDIIEDTSPGAYHSDMESSVNSRMSSVEGDVCFPTPNKKEESGIDYECLENFIAKEKKELQEDRKDGTKRRRRLSTMGGSENRRYSMYGSRTKVFIYNKMVASSIIFNYFII